MDKIFIVWVDDGSMAIWGIYRTVDAAVKATQEYTGEGKCYMEAWDIDD